MQVASRSICLSQLHQNSLEDIAHDRKETCTDYVSRSVRRSRTSTSSLSATSIPASRPPPAVSYPPYVFQSCAILIQISDLIYKCGGIDKRTIEKFEKVRYSWNPTRLAEKIGAKNLACLRIFCPSFPVGQQADGGLARALLTHRHNPHGNVETTWRARLYSDYTCCLANNKILIILHRKPPSWARVPSSTHGCLTSSRLSASVVSPLTLLSGSSRLPSELPLPYFRKPTCHGQLCSKQPLTSIGTMSLSSTPPVTAISSRT